MQPLVLSFDHCLLALQRAQQQGRELMVVDPFHLAASSADDDLGESFGDLLGDQSVATALGAVVSRVPVVERDRAQP